MKGTNSVGAMGYGGVGRTLREARIADLAAFDALPPAVCAVVRENVISLNCDSVYRHLRQAAMRFGAGAGVLATIDKLRSLEAGELAVFAGRHKGAHGYDLPHVAAMASIVRYGSARPGRRRRVYMIQGFGLPGVEEVA